MTLSDFQIISKLGEGAYSSVYKVKRISDSALYALKKVRLMNLSDKEKYNALNEVRILASIRHPNVIMYKEAFLEEKTNSLCIIMEFCDNGDLYQKIVAHIKKKKLFKETEIWNVFIQMIKGLKALHDMNIFHRDLKSANIFLNKDGTAKLGDLNVSKLAKRGLLYTQTGTPYYASPEVWKDKPYNEKSDIWSMGCVFYEMTTLKPPFHAKDMEGLYNKVIRGMFVTVRLFMFQGYYNKIPSHYSKDLSNIINVCLQVSASLRPSCNKLLSFPATVKRLNENCLQSVIDERDPELMKTIVVPKNLHILSETLPPCNYDPLETKTIEKQAFLQTLAGYKLKEHPKDDKAHSITKSMDIEHRSSKDKRKKEKMSQSLSHEQLLHQQKLKSKNKDRYKRNRGRRRSQRYQMDYNKRRNHRSQNNSNSPQSRNRKIYQERRRQREIERKNKYSDYILQQKMLAKYGQVSNSRNDTHRRGQYNSRYKILHQRKKVGSLSPIRGYHRNLNKYYQQQNNPYSRSRGYQSGGQGKQLLPSLSQAIQVNKIDVKMRDPSPYQRNNKQKLKLLKIKEIENAYLMKNKPKRYNRKSLQKHQKHKYSIKDLKEDPRYSQGSSQINSINRKQDRRRLPTINRQNKMHNDDQ